MCTYVVVALDGLCVILYAETSSIQTAVVDEAWELEMTDVFVCSYLWCASKMIHPTAQMQGWEKETHIGLIFSVSALINHPDKNID